MGQKTFAAWCDVSPDTIASVETGRLVVSDDLAERLHRISGAPKEWLQGRGNVGAYKVRNLQEWFPLTFQLEFSRDGRLKGDRVSVLQETWLPVVEPALRMAAVWGAWGETERMADGFRKVMQTLHLGNSPRAPLEDSMLWMAFAFAKHGEELRQPFAMKLLDPVVDEAKESMGVELGAGNLGKLLHYTIFLRSRHERNEYEQIQKKRTTG